MQRLLEDRAASFTPSPPSSFCSITRGCRLDCRSRPPSLTPCNLHSLLSRPPHGLSKPFPLSLNHYPWPPGLPPHLLSTLPHQAPCWGWLWSALSPLLTPRFQCKRLCCAQLLQSCPTLCDPVDYSPPGSSVHGILQARVLEWVAISFSRGSSQPRDRTQVSCIAGRRFTVWATRKCSISLSRLYYVLSTVLVPRNHTEQNNPLPSWCSWSSQETGPDEEYLLWLLSSSEITNWQTSWSPRSYFVGLTLYTFDFSFDSIFFQFWKQCLSRLRQVILFNVSKYNNIQKILKYICAWQQRLKIHKAKINWRNRLIFGDFETPSQ